MTEIQEQVVSASRTIGAPSARIFELIADPARQPEWDGNDNLEPIDESNTLVTHTYDWTKLTDELRLPRARATTADNLRASLDRLAEVAGRA